MRKFKDTLIILLVKIIQLWYKNIHITRIRHYRRLLLQNQGNSSRTGRGFQLLTVISPSYFRIIPPVHYIQYQLLIGTFAHSEAREASGDITDKA